MITYVVYILTLLLSLLLARAAQKKNKKKYIVFAALVLTVVAGLRAQSVGIDTKNYAELFARIAEGRLDLAYGLETSFKYVCVVLLGIWNNFNFLYFVFALITNCFIFVRLWDFKDQISLPWATAIYFGVFYFMTFNIMRQFVAAAIIFYGTRYLVKKKYFKFLIFVAAAFLFHKSALLGVGFIALDIFAWKHLEKWQKRLLRWMIVLGSVVVVAFGAVIIGRYASYFDEIKFNFGLMLFFKLFIFILSVIVFSNPYTKETDENGYSEKAYVFTTVRVYYLVGILATMLEYFFAYMGRIGIYFYLFEAVYLGMMFKSRKIDVFMKILMVAVIMLYLCTAIFGNGQGQGNYLFFWQSEPALA